MDNEPLRISSNSIDLPPQSQSVNKDRTFIGEQDEPNSDYGQINGDTKEISDSQSSDDSQSRNSDSSEEQD